MTLKFKKIFLLLVLILNIPILHSIEINSATNENETIIMEPNALSISQKWNFTTDLIVRSASVTADINADGYLETLFGSGGLDFGENDETLFCLDHNGDVLWTFNSTGDIITCPVVADLDNDNNFEIIFGTMMGDDYLVCLDSQGNLLWNRTLNGLVASAPAVADINLDGYQEILVCGSNWWFYCIDYTGSQVWNYTNPDITNLYGSPAIGEIKNDNGLEVVFGTMFDLYFCLNSTGQLVYTYNHTEYTRSSPIIVDLENDGANEILVYANDTIICLDNTFNLKWKYDCEDLDSISLAPSLADVNSDGFIEILITFSDYDTLTPFITCLNSTGHELWSYDLLGDFASPSVIGDIENDNIVDIILLDSSGHTYCLDGNGSVNWIHNITVSAFPPGGHSIPSPTLGDIDFDNVTEVIIETSNDGDVICFDFDGITSSGITQWHCLRGTMFHTGQMDRDGDFLDDVNEQFYGTLKDDWDTDDDLISDGREVFFGFDPTDEFDPYAITSPTPTETSPLFGSLISIMFSISSIFVMAVIVQRKREK
ncbi:MAG: PQQ-like beta-propeller repeat protein [Asgard group archaeon]|nr:PQQ-like beta-propeller repeat protein [Asgard group archaeon]